MEIKLTKGKTTTIDEKDSDLAGFNWCINSAGYAKRGLWGIICSTEYLHRVILGRVLGRNLTKGDYVDHIDKNPLNNARSNLRLATNTQNAYNMGPHKDNLCGYKGVSKKRKRWLAQITVDGEAIRLGLFDSPEEAAKAYNDAAKEMHGEFAYLNEIPS